MLRVPSSEFCKIARKIDVIVVYKVDRLTRSLADFTKLVELFDAPKTVVALEKAKTEKEVHGEFESECPGYCGSQDTFYVGNMKGVGRIYQQTFIDTYTAFSETCQHALPQP